MSNRLTNEQYAVLKRRHEIWKRKDALVVALESLPRQCDGEKAFQNLLTLNRCLNGSGELPSKALFNVYC